MAMSDLENLIREAENLSPTEQLRLAAHLAEKARQTDLASRARRSWDELCGAAPSPLLGEDAQTWVSRTRKEGEAFRERLWKGES
jgi:hypothetical protein